jgi:cyanophycinase-like exopeptidase
MGSFFFLSRQRYALPCPIFYEMKNIQLTFLLIGLSLSLSAQPYTSWIVGSAADVTTNHEAGTVLAGGGSDNDDAMAWMLERANGGDVVVIRSSGSNGYNNYFYSQLGVSVNSVETILIPSYQAATDPYVAQQIENAEVLFIAGGDQYDYWNYWQASPVQDAINYLIHVKGATVGGTSAGMAIMGSHYYAPENLGVTSNEALGNPYHTNMDFIGQNDFIDNSFLGNTITDTHFDQRNRAGRTFTFLARMKTDWDINGYAIACNEVTTVCIDENGIATVFGEYPNYDDFAYFMQVNCTAGNTPERCQPDKRLWWQRDRRVVKVYKVPGTISGSNTFDLTDWVTGNGGSWEDWFVNRRGNLRMRTNATPPNCGETPLQDPPLIEKTIITEESNADVPAALDIAPNPAGNIIRISTHQDQPVEVRILDIPGRVISTHIVQNGDYLQIDHLETGLYVVCASGSSQLLVKQ